MKGFSSRIFCNPLVSPLQLVAVRAARGAELCNLNAWCWGNHAPPCLFWTCCYLFHSTSLDLLAGTPVRDHSFLPSLFALQKCQMSAAPSFWSRNGCIFTYILFFQHLSVLAKGWYWWLSLRRCTHRRTHLLTHCRRGMCTSKSIHHHRTRFWLWDSAPPHFVKLKWSCI